MIEKIEPLPPIPSAPPAAPNERWGLGVEVSHLFEMLRHIAATLRYRQVN
jgi:hypothetical protein